MRNPRFLAGATIALWSFAGILGRLVAMRSQFALLSLSFLFTFGALLVYSLLSQGRSFLERLKRARAPYFLIGLTGYFIYWIGINQSYRAFDAASETIVLNYTWPVFTVVFTDLVFRRGPRSRAFRLVEALGIAGGFLSVVVLATKGRFTSFELNVAGIAWGLLGGVSYGFFSAYSSTVPREEHSTFLLCSILASLVLIAGLALREIPLFRTFTARDILTVALLGCALDGLGYICWTAANRLARERGTEISSVASLMFVLPLFSLSLIALFFKEESLSRPYFLASLALLLASSVLCQRTQAIARLLSRLGRKRPGWHGSGPYARPDDGR